MDLWFFALPYAQMDHLDFKMVRVFPADISIIHAFRECGMAEIEAFSAVELGVTIWPQRWWFKYSTSVTRRQEEHYIFTSAYKTWSYEAIC